MEKKKKFVIALAIVSFLVLGVIALSIDFEKEGSDLENKEKNSKNEQVQFEIENAYERDWSQNTLVNVINGNEFKISDFENEEHVLLESFAVWCPTCTKQQEEIKKFHKKTQKEVQSISLNTDPNEDSQKVKNHAQKNNFDWIYSISPKETTNKLIDQFGQSFVNAPQSPVVLICKDGKAKMLERGVKTSKDLEKSLDNC